MKKAILFTLCLGIIISLFSLPVSADPAMAEFTELASGFELTIAEPASGDSWQLWVGKKGVTEDNLAAIGDEDDFMDMVGYVDFAMAKNVSPITFTFDLSGSTDYGYYAARLIRSGADDDIEEAYYTYKYVDPMLSVKAMEAFMAVKNDEEFSAKLSEFSTAPNDFFSEADLGILVDKDIAASVGNNFALVRDYKYSNGGGFETAGDIMRCAEAAYALSALLGDDVKEAADRISKYGSYISECFPTKDNTNATMKLIAGGKEYITDGQSLGSILVAAKTHGAKADDNTLKLFDSLKAEINSAENFETVTKWASMLSKLSSGTRDDIAKLISDNSVFFGVDLDELDSSLSEISVEFDTDDIARLYGTDKFSGYIYEIDGEIEASKKQNSSRPSVKDKGNNKSYTYVGGSPLVTSKPEDNAGTIQDSDQNKVFVDTDSVPWALDAIAELYNKQIVSGIGQGSFEPQRPVTREEFVKMIVVAFDIKGDSASDFVFHDVTTENWSYPYIKSAYLAGVVNGVSKTHFGPKDVITRQDAAVMLARVMNITQSSETADFWDSNMFSDYAKGYIASLTKIGLISGRGDGSFGPAEVSTRAEAAVMIHRAINYMGGNQ